jgi:tRNA nucleotidyltransferase/poly(A) polymerase
MLNRLKDVFASFQKHDVHYLVIGGVASVLYGVPRATFDIDILIDATPDNATKLLEALLEAGLGTSALITPDELLNNEITIFRDRVRVDVQTATPGIQFSDAWSRRTVMTYENQSFFVASKEDLIASKKASARPVDLEDVRLLELPGDSNG